jgi:hypothetical protein
MIRTNTLWLFATVFALAACDKPKWAEPAAQSSAAGIEVATAATATPQPATPTTQDPLPASPEWASALMGQPFQKALPKLADCSGNLDVVTERYMGSAPGTKVIGWGWVLKSQKPIDHVVLVDQNAVIVGAGEGGQPRPDVPANSPTVKSANTGWAAYTSMTKGPVDAYGVIDGAARCPLGHLDL